MDTDRSKEIEREDPPEATESGPTIGQQGGMFELLKAEPVPFLISLLALLAIVALFFGQKVPHSNEFVYLLRLEPGFLPNDWTFSRPAYEHGFFNLVFSVPASVLSVEAMGWAGRVLVWVGCMIPLILLGRLWSNRYLWVTAAIAVWLAYGQTVANNVWFFGGFEAGAASASLLLFSLLAFTSKKYLCAGLLMGLAFSIHPGVGLWAIPAAMFALVVERVPPREIFVTGFAIVAAAIPGLLFIVSDQIGGGATTYDDWRYLVIHRVPWHLDPFYFSRRDFVILAAMLGFNFAIMGRSTKFALRFLFKFQLLLAAVFASAIIFRWFELYPLLRFQPMRLFPVVVGIFFLFSAFYVINASKDLWKRVSAALLAALLVALLNPVSYISSRLDTFVDSWTFQVSDVETAFRWVAENTPEDAIVIAPPNHIEVWYYTRRANIASFRYPTYDRFGEWRKRIGDLTGTTESSARDDDFSDTETRFSSLSEAQILSLKDRYSADYLISRGKYDLPKVFETGTYVIYKLR